MAHKTTNDAAGDTEKMFTTEERYAMDPKTVFMVGERNAGCEYYCVHCSTGTEIDMAVYDVMSDEEGARWMCCNCDDDEVVNGHSIK